MALSSVSNYSYKYFKKLIDTDGLAIGNVVKTFYQIIVEVFVASCCQILLTALVPWGAYHIKRCEYHRKYSHAIRVYHAQRPDRKVDQAGTSQLICLQKEKQKVEDSKRTGEEEREVLVSQGRKSRETEPQVRTTIASRGDIQSEDLQAEKTRAWPKKEVFKLAQVELHELIKLQSATALSIIKVKYIVTTQACKEVI